MGNACIFSSISHNMGKTTKPIEWGKPRKLIRGNILQNPLYVENLGNWYSYFSHSMAAFFHYIPILWYTSSHGKCTVFVIKFP